MTTSNFLKLLEDNPTKELVFEYRTQTFVPKAYHITEIKNVSVESVDCGGNPHDYKETIVQLWIDGVETQDRYMTAEKANKIFKIVNGVKPLNQEAPILFEWGMDGLATSNYQVNQVDHQEDKIVVKMSVPATACKPRLIQLETVSNGGSCNPNSGCC